MQFNHSQLRDRVKIYRQVKTENDYSEKEKQYQFAFWLRVEATWIGGNQNAFGKLQNYGRIEKFKSHHSFTRYKETMLIEFRGDFYEILSIDPDKNRMFVIITATRKPAGTFNITEMISVIYDDTIINDYDIITN